jgi:hypothetical protein
MNPQAYSNLVLYWRTQVNDVDSKTSNTHSEIFPHNTFVMYSSQPGVKGHDVSCELSLSAISRALKRICGDQGSLSKGRPTRYLRNLSLIV